MPLEHGPAAVRRVIEWIRANRFPVFFPIEVRVTAGDDADLSAAHERPTAYIAVHQYRGMEWRPYFEAVESIMDDYGGRPHWGKRHFQTAETLAPPLPAVGRVPERPRRARPGARLHQRVRRAGPRPVSGVGASLEEGLALAPVGRDDVDDLVAFDQVEDVEALAQLARLGVAHVDAIADLEVRGRRSQERGLDLAGALLGVELQPLRQPRRRDARGIARARRDVAAAERGRHLRRRLADDRQREARRPGSGVKRS